VRSGAPRSTGTTTNASSICPPTKKAIASTWSQRMVSQSIERTLVPDHAVAPCALGRVQARVRQGRDAVELGALIGAGDADRGGDRQARRDVRPSRPADRRQRA